LLSLTPGAKIELGDMQTAQFKKMEKCNYTSPVHWDCGHGASSTCAMIPLDNTDANGTAFQFASSSCSYAPDNATSTVFATFTYGEIMIGTFLFLALCLASYSFLWFSLRRVKIKKTPKK